MGVLFLTYFIAVGVDEAGCCFETPVVCVGGLFGDIVRCAQLDVRFFEIIFDTSMVLVNPSANVLVVRIDSLGLT